MNTLLSRRSLLVLIVTGLALVGLAQIARAGEPAGATAPNFRVAFLGDQGIGPDAQAVLQLIADESADIVLHMGDLGYGNETDPQRAIDWDAQITATLGADFPYFATIGNHDVGNWSTYQQLLADRLALIPGASCSGDYGVMAACTYQGLFFILSGAGTSPDLPDYGPHVDYIRAQLEQDNSIWRICAWHKNQTAMQVGSKTNEVGWQPYEECRLGRALVATGHEHSYERTRVLTSTQAQSVDPAWADPDLLRVSNGSTVVFVSGLGGQSIRDQDRCLPTTPPYGCNQEWASIYSSDQGANYGALFIDFHVDGNPRKAEGYFKNVDGDVVDSFTVFADQAIGGVVELPAADLPPGADSGLPPREYAVLAATIGALFGMVLLGKRALSARRRS